MPRQRMTTADRDPVERLDALRPTPPSRPGWIPGPATASEDGPRGGDPDGAGNGAPDRAGSGASDRAEDWRDAPWSAEDLLTFGPPADELDLVEDPEAQLTTIGSLGADLRPAEPGASGEAAPAAFRARRVRARRWGRLAEAWVPEQLRDARVDPGRRGALALTLVAALAAVVAAIGVWRDRPEPRPVQPVATAPLTDTVGADPAGSGGRPDRASTARSLGGRSAAGRPSGGGSAAQDSVPAGPAVIAVSVTGLVRKPGLIRLPAGSRVADAIAAVGGTTGEGTVTGLNLAAALSDGDSVVVGAPPATPGPGSGPHRSNTVTAVAPGARPSGAPVNLNTADAATLETLPGVGPVMAANIIAWREQNGSFGSVEQLQEVTGIGPARYAQLAPLLAVQ